MKKIDIYNNLWFGSVIGIIVSLSMNFILVQQGQDRVLINFILFMLASSLVGIGIAFGGEGVYQLLRKLGVKSIKVIVVWCQIYYAFITVVVTYFSGLRDPYAFILAAAIVSIATLSLTFLEQVRVKEMNKNLINVKERFKKSQG